MRRSDDPRKPCGEVARSTKPTTPFTPSTSAPNSTTNANTIKPRGHSDPETLRRSAAGRNYLDDFARRARLRIFISGRYFHDLFKPARLFDHDRRPCGYVGLRQ